MADCASVDFTNWDIRRETDRTAFEEFLRDRAEQVEALAKKVGVELQLAVDATVAAEVLFRIGYDAEKLDGPDLTKQCALFTFWVKKLKPIVVSKSEVVAKREYYLSDQKPETWQRYASEIVGLLGASVILTTWRNVRIRPKFFMDLFYDLRFRAWSPNCLMLLYQAIWGKESNDTGEQYCVEPC